MDYTRPADRRMTTSDQGLATRDQGLGLLHPPRRQDSPARAGTVGAPAEQILPPGERLIEESLLLQRLAKNHAEHDAVARVGHLLDGSAPAIDERLSGVTVFVR